MKITIWGQASPSLSGLERFSEELARWLSGRGHELRLVTWTPPVGSMMGVVPYLERAQWLRDCAEIGTRRRRVGQRRGISRKADLHERMLGRVYLPRPGQ